jgi:hypothetical protein
MVITVRNTLKTVLTVKGSLREINHNLLPIIDRCRRQLLTNHLEIYSDVLHTDTGETLYFDATLYEEEGKLPQMRVRFNDESEWLKED